MNVSETISTTPSPAGTGPMLTTKESAEQLKISERSLLRMVEKKAFPEGIRVGRRWRWPAETITQWIASKSAEVKGGAQ